MYARQSDPGDLVIGPKLREHFPFHVECKHGYPNATLDRLLEDSEKWVKDHPFKMWFRQIENAQTDGMEPLIVYRQNHKEILCITKHYRAVFLDKPHLKFWYKMSHWYVIPFKQFLKDLS